MDMNMDIMKDKLPTWLQPVFKSQNTLGVEGVPAPMKELFILSGFRLMEKPWNYYLLSLFNWHNETINVWTHLLSFVYVIIHTSNLSVIYDMYNTSVGAVVIAYSIGAAAVTLLSTVAHLFHSRSLTYHYLFFALDYMGVSLYCFGCGVLTHYCFCAQETFDAIGQIYVPVHFILCFITFMACTVAKLLFTNTKRKVLMISACAVLTLWLLIPIFARYYYCLVDISCTILSINHLGAMYVGLFLATIAYVAHQPEKSKPGAFDIIGHGHQLFHIFIFCTILAQFNAMEKELHIKGTVIEHVSVHYMLTGYVLLFVLEVLAMKMLLPQLHKKVKEIEICEGRKKH